MNLDRIYGPGEAECHPAGQLLKAIAGMSPAMFNDTHSHAEVMEFLATAIAAEAAKEQP